MHLTKNQVGDIVDITEGKIPTSLTEEELRKLILEATADEADYGNPETYHARYDHLERGLQFDDVLHGLDHQWRFERPPKFNKKFWQWKYYLDTESVDGKRITIVVAVDTLDKSFEVITRWT
jgi:hypothetical protein